MVIRSAATTRQTTSAPGTITPPRSGLFRNDQIATNLLNAADILAIENGSPFRVTAYRRAADAIRQLDRDIATIEAEGALDAIPSLSPSIARSVAELVRTGRWRFLERLRARMCPMELFKTIPGIGPTLARRLHETAHIDTLQALETAAHEGRLNAILGLSPRRGASICNAIAEMLKNVQVRSSVAPDEPDIGMLLDVDREFREATTPEQLDKIDAKRFVPSGEARFPEFRAGRDRWEFRAFYSNKERARKSRCVLDRVVILFRTAGQNEMQRTVVTGRRVPFAGKRVVRGREMECRCYYGTAA